MSLNFINFGGFVGGYPIAAELDCCALPGTKAGAAIALVSPLFDGTHQSGVYGHTFDLTDSAVYNSAFLIANGGTAASAEAALLAGMNADTAYVNIYTAAFPDGEIRGNLILVPEPATFGLSSLALAGLFALKRRISA